LMRAVWLESTTTACAEVADDDRLLARMPTRPLAQHRVDRGHGRLGCPRLPWCVPQDPAGAVDHRHPALDRAIAGKPDGLAGDAGLAPIDHDLGRWRQLTLERDPGIERLDLVVIDLVQVGHYLHRAAALDRVGH